VPAQRPECTVEGCGRPTVARGRCRTHYGQWRTHDPSRPRCQAPGCSNFVNAKGLCHTHYKRAIKVGVIRPRPVMSAAARFWARCIRDGECLIFTGTPKDPYGQVVIDGQHLRGRVYVWTLAFGPPPPLGVVRTTCGRLRCVERTHLTLELWAPGLPPLNRRADTVEEPAPQDGLLVALGIAQTPYRGTVSRPLRGRDRR